MSRELHELLLAARSDELGALQGALAASSEGSARLVLLTGAPGVGRTTLLDAFARSVAARRRTAVIQLRPPTHGAYEPVTHAGLATSPALYRRFGGARQARAMAGWLVPEWLGAIPGWGDLAGAIGATVDAVRRRRDGVVLPRSALRDESIEAILLAARTRTLVLLIDDAERAVATDAHRLATLLDDAPAGTRLLVVAACAVRPEPSTALNSLFGRSDATVITLEDLSLRALHALLASRYPGADVEALAIALEKTTGGHPATLVATLQALEHEGSIVREGTTWRIDADGVSRLTTSVDVRPRVATALDAETARILAHAAGLGSSFAALTVARDLGLSELAVEDHLALAERHHVVGYVGVESLPGGASTSIFRFRNSRQYVAHRPDP